METILAWTVFLLLATAVLTGFLTIAYFAVGLAQRIRNRLIVWILLRRFSRWRH